MPSEEKPVVESIEGLLKGATFVEWQGMCPFCKRFALIRGERGLLKVGHARPSCATFLENDAEQFFELCKQKAGLRN